MKAGALPFLADEEVVRLGEAPQARGELRLELGERPLRVGRAARHRGDNGEQILRAMGKLAHDEPVMLLEPSLLRHVGTRHRPARGNTGTVEQRARGSAHDPLLAGLLDEKFQLQSITTRDFVPFAYSESATAILNLTPIDPGATGRPPGLLYRKPLGAGQIFCWATLPDSRWLSGMRR